MKHILKLQIVKWYFNRHGIDNDPFLAMAISTAIDIIHEFMSMGIPPYPSVITTMLSEMYGWDCGEIDIEEIIRMVKEVME